MGKRWSENDINFLIDNVSYDIKSFDIDHITPLRTAKTIQQIKNLFVLKNLSLLCYPCNRYIKRGRII